jgi:HNH endonuclease/NUMOD4 motif
MEKWRSVAGLEAFYAVSDQGRVRSLDRAVIAHTVRGLHVRRYVGKLLSPGRMPGGHLSVVLGRSVGSKCVHDLVLRAFIGLPPPFMECRHLDGNPANNKLENLCWGTRSENMQDVKYHGGRNNYTLKPEDVVYIRNMIGKVTQKSLAEKFGVTCTTINDIKFRRSHRDL